MCLMFNKERFDVHLKPVLSRVLALMSCRNANQIQIQVVWFVFAAVLVW